MDDPTSLLCALTALVPVGFVLLVLAAASLGWTAMLATRVAHLERELRRLREALAATAAAPSETQGATRASVPATAAVATGGAPAPSETLGATRASVPPTGAGAPSETLGATTAPVPPTGAGAPSETLGATTAPVPPTGAGAPSETLGATTAPVPPTGAGAPSGTLGATGEPPARSPGATGQPPPKEPWQPPSVEWVLIRVAAGIGGFMLLLGLVLLVAVAFSEGWVGPAARIAMGLVAGTAAWVVGDVLRGRAGAASEPLAATGTGARPSSVPASALSGGGVGGLFGALYAAHGVYGFTSVPVTFALLVAVVVVAMAMAIRRHDRFLAWLAVLGAFLTPILLATGENKPVPFFSWLLLVSVAACAVGARRSWPDLIVLALIGDVLCHVGWAATWYAADQAPVALVAATALAIPFAAAAWREPTGVRLAGLAGALILPLVAIPWVIPVDPVFTDPKTYVQVTRPLAAAAPVAALGLAVVPLPAWVAGRRHALSSVASAFVAAALLLAWTVGWLDTADPPPAALAWGAVAVLSAVLATLGAKGRTGWKAGGSGRGGIGDRRPDLDPSNTGTGAAGADDAAWRPSSASRSAVEGGAWGVVAVPVLAGLALAGVVGVSSPAPSAFGGAAILLVLLGWLAARSSTSAWVVLTAALGLALPLALAADDVDRMGLRWVLGPTMVAFAVLVDFPLLARWDDDDRDAAWTSAALAGPALFPTFHLLWKAGLGESAIGVLPVLVGVNALLSAGILVRAQRVDRRSRSLAMFVAVALFGVTAAVPLQLETRWLTVAWAVEAAALAVVAVRLSHPLLRWFAFGLGLAVSVRLVVNPWALAWGSAEGWPVLNWTLYTWGVPMVALLVADRFLAVATERWATGTLKSVEAWFPPILRATAILVGFALVNVEVSQAFQSGPGPLELSGHGLVQGMVRSLCWAAYGMALLGLGLVRDRRALRLAGFAFVMLATAKVFVVDLWQLSGFVRVGSVLGLGLSLLVAAFLFERVVLRPRPTPSEDPV